MLGRRNVPDRCEQAPGVESLDPLERREFHGPDFATDLIVESLRPNNPNHRLGDRVVARTAPAADGQFDARIRQPLCEADRQILRAATAVMLQVPGVGVAAIVTGRALVGSD